MKKSRFTEAQILKVLQSQQQGSKVVQICREYGISEKTFYNWPRSHGSATLKLLGTP
mgnify:CR=1 FL=1|jgi:putative transposase